MDPEKLAVVQDWPPPATVRQVRSFLGFVGYYQWFIIKVSKIAAPLHALLMGTATLGKKTATVNWTLQCQVAFEELKIALVSAPI